jgi:hypothetical protein
MDHAFEPQAPHGYQPGGQAWAPDRPDILELLETAKHAQIYPIYQGSNHTFLALLDAEERGRSLAVYKPARGEYPLYDFPSGTLYRREIGAFVLDRVLGWAVVPPTVEGKGQHGVGSMQLFIESPQEAEVEIGELRRIAVLDALLNNADRKADHCLPALDGRLWAIDHGLTFHVQPKMRTVLWHFAGSRLTKEERRDIERACGALKESRGEAARLRELISAGEWRALIWRVERLLESNRLPDPKYKPVPYRW